MHLFVRVWKVARACLEVRYIQTIYRGGRRNLSWWFVVVVQTEMRTCCASSFRTSELRSTNRLSVVCESHTVSVLRVCILKKNQSRSMHTVSLPSAKNYSVQIDSTTTAGLQPSPQNKFHQTRLKTDSVTQLFPKSGTLTVCHPRSG